MGERNTAKVGKTMPSMIAPMASQGALANKQAADSRAPCFGLDPSRA